MLYALRVIQVVNILAATVQTLPELTAYDLFLNQTDSSFERTAPDSKPWRPVMCSPSDRTVCPSVALASAGFFSRALGNVVRLVPPMRIGSRFNQGCVGGTKCQFFAFCWLSGGSLGASCGPLHTCCVTPSSQDIQPQYWGPVVNDPRKHLF